MIHLPLLILLLCVVILGVSNMPDPLRALRKVYPDEVLFITSALGFLFMTIGSVLGILSEKRKSKS